MSAAKMYKQSTGVWQGLDLQNGERIVGYTNGMGKLGIHIQKVKLHCSFMPHKRKLKWIIDLKGRP